MNPSLSTTQEKTGMGQFAAIRNRLTVIEKYAKGKDVLDVGCVDARPDGSVKYQSTGLHLFLKRHAQALLGLDIDREGVEMVRRDGLDVVAGNAEEVNLGRQFDCIIAGEVIEHLSNFGLFLDNMHRHLKEEGHLIITTPNAFAISNIFRIFRKNRIRVHGAHTCWFDPLTLSQLLERHGFEAVEAMFSNNAKWYDRKYLFKLNYHLFKMLSSLRNYFAATVIVVARKRQVPDIATPGAATGMVQPNT